MTLEERIKKRIAELQAERARRIGELMAAYSAAIGELEGLLKPEETEGGDADVVTQPASSGEEAEAEAQTLNGQPVPNYTHPDGPVSIIRARDKRPVGGRKRSV